MDNMTIEHMQAEILASPAYQERCELLFDLFLLSRKADKDPVAILSIQYEMVQLMMHFQQKKAEFRSEGNKLGVAVVNRLILVLYRIADSIVWKVLNYDRVLIQLLAEHSKTGQLDETVYKDIDMAQKLAEEYQAIVLVNDLTSILRHGDLTIINQSGFVIQENKYGKAASRNRAAIRQKRRMEKLISFLQTGVRLVDDRRDFIFLADVDIKTNHAAIQDVINQTRINGYANCIINDCVAVEVVSFGGNNKVPPNRPFQGRQHIVHYHNLWAFDKSASRVAPYGIFPLADKDCFDLLTGYLLVIVTIDFDVLQGKYRQVGLLLNLPRFSDDEIKIYISSSINERKKMMGFGLFYVRDDKWFYSVTPDLYARIGIEFLDETVLIQSDRQMMDFIKAIDSFDDKKTRFYMGYKNETGIWV
jgi:hypothetical protein